MLLCGMAYAGGARPRLGIDDLDERRSGAIRRLGQSDGAFTVGELGEDDVEVSGRDAEAAADDGVGVALELLRLEDRCGRLALGDGSDARTLAHAAASPHVSPSRTPVTRPFGTSPKAEGLSPGVKPLRQSIHSCPNRTAVRARIRSARDLRG
jgi:hypothetical protein